MSGSIHPTAIIESGATIGPDCSIWHYAHIRKGARLGANVGVGKNGYIGVDVQIGSGCRIQNNVSIFRGVTLENDVFVGPGVVFTNDLYPRTSSIDWKVVPTTVCNGASLGANATILCGIEIGEFAMIGAGAVVTDDVEPYALVVGSPARAIGWVCRAGHRVDSPPAKSADCECNDDGMS